LKPLMCHFFERLTKSKRKFSSQCRVSSSRLSEYERHNLNSTLQFRFFGSPDQPLKVSDLKRNEIQRDVNEGSFMLFISAIFVSATNDTFEEHEILFAYFLRMLHLNALTKWHNVSEI